MKSYSSPLTPKTPTTWKLDGIVHEVFHVQDAGRSFTTGKHRWILRTACGVRNAIDDTRALVPRRRVDCITCIATEPQKTLYVSAPTNPCAEIPLSGLKADMIIIDEAQDFVPAEPGILKTDDE